MNRWSKLVAGTVQPFRTGIADAGAPDLGPMPVQGGGAAASSASMSVTPASDLAGWPLGATERHIGNVTGQAAVVNQTLVLDTNIYAIGDVLAVPAAVTLLRVVDGTALLQSLVVTDEDDQGFGLDLYFFDSAVASLGTLNGAVSISDAHSRSILGMVRIAAADFIDLGGVRQATKAGLGLLLQAASGEQSVYVGAVAQGAGTYTASGIRVRYGVQQN